MGSNWAAAVPGERNSRQSRSDKIVLRMIQPFIPAVDFYSLPSFLNLNRLGISSPG